MSLHAIKPGFHLYYQLGTSFETFDCSSVFIKLVTLLLIWFFQFRLDVEVWIVKIHTPTFSWKKTLNPFFFVKSHYLSRALLINVIMWGENVRDIGYMIFSERGMRKVNIILHLIVLKSIKKYLCHTLGWTIHNLNYYNEI